MGRMLREFKREAFNDFRDMLRDHIKSKDYRKAFQRYASLPELYKRHEVRLHCHFRSPFPEFCAVLEYREPGGLEGFRVADDVQAVGAIGDGGDLEHPMLVRIVHFVEEPQGTELAPPHRTVAAPLRAVPIA